MGVIDQYRREICLHPWQPVGRNFFTKQQHRISWYRPGLYLDSRWQRFRGLAAKIGAVDWHFVADLVTISRMFQYVALAESKPWVPGPYPGVELCVLHRNDATGGVSVLRKFHAGITVPAHVHSLANESAYVLSGEWEESGTVYGPGSFFFAPKGERHGPHMARTEVVSLTVFDGPLTVA
jgi:quercetin dioxygenase-like cupin family protein